MFDINPFNGVFLVTFSLFLALLIVSSVLLRKADRKIRRRTLAGAMIFTFAAYWVYKFALSMDDDYSELTAANDLGAFSWWKELPFQLCNINMIIIPLAAIFDNKKLYGFGFFVAPLGAFMALIMPSLGFYGCSIFLPRNLGFYFTHFMIFIGGISIACLDLYKPRFKDVLHTQHTMMVITMVVVGMDFLICGTVEPYANYFFAMNPEGISILELFWSWIPVKGLYLVSAGALVLLPYMLIITFAFWLPGEIKKKIAVRSSEEIVENE